MATSSDTFHFPSAPASSFGRFVLLDRIATGGMAEVYLANAQAGSAEKLVAIKRILPTLEEDEEFIDMFLDEAKIAGRLKHPNIGQILELGRVGSSHYIVMEYIWGKDLLQVMNRHRKRRETMDYDRAAWIAREMCAALQYAHDRKDERGQPMNIVHRDVSPQNTLIGYDGQVKLIDFGIARATARATHTQAGVLKGKFGYMSPEQAFGKPLDRRSDVFAVGICLWEMLATERLFVGPTDVAVLDRVQNADVPPIRLRRPDVPNALEVILSRTLTRDANDRYRDASAMQRDLDRYLVSRFGPTLMADWMRNGFEAELSKERAQLLRHRGQKYDSQPAPAPQTRVAEEATAPMLHRHMRVGKPPPEVTAAVSAAHLAQMVANAGGAVMEEQTDPKPHRLFEDEGASTVVRPEEEPTGPTGSLLTRSDPPEATTVFFLAEDWNTAQPSLDEEGTEGAPTEPIDRPDYNSAPIPRPRLSPKPLANARPLAAPIARATPKPPSTTPISAPASARTPASVPRPMPAPVRPVPGKPGMLPRTTDPNRAGAAMPAPLRVAPANPLGSRSDPTPSIPFRTQAREPSQPFSTGDPNARIQAALAPTMAETRLPPRKKSQARLVAIVAVLFVCVAVISTALILRFQSKAVGSVLVHTDPEGATVTLDGERYGQTPLQIDEIAVGEHRLRAVRGALRGSSTIQIVENAEPQPVTIPLAPP